MITKDDVDKEHIGYYVGEAMVKLFKDPAILEIDENADEFKKIYDHVSISALAYAGTQIVDINDDVTVCDIKNTMGKILDEDLSHRVVMSGAMAGFLMGVGWALENKDNLS